jgi:phosphoglycolate phosphatase-like HAD superfamily hydrolase
MRHHMRIPAATCAATAGLSPHSRKPDEILPMIRALLLDLGGTLIDDNKTALPGVTDALALLQGFETADHQPLVCCLVSDFTMPQPRTAAAIAGAFADYLKILDHSGLRSWFEPVEQRVTLSTHAGVNKPDAAVFAATLKRAGIHAPLSEAMFITENAGHVAAARKLGMTALQFGADFTEWATAPLLIAQQIGVPKNSEAALAPALAADHGLRLQSLHSVGPDHVRGTAHHLVKLNAPELGALDGVHVELPTDIEARIDPAGRITAVKSSPRPGDVAEAVQNLQTLAANRQVSDGPADPASPVLPTHQVATDEQGRRVLRRRRFTAW